MCCDLNVMEKMLVKAFDISEMLGDENCSTKPPQPWWWTLMTTSSFQWIFRIFSTQKNSHCMKLVLDENICFLADECLLSL